MSIFFAEILGTFILIYLGCGVVAGDLLTFSKAKGSGWIIITLAWGLAVTLAIYAVGNISGAHINPAVTIGLAASSEFNEQFKGWSDVPIYCIGQLIGAMLGAAMVYFTIYPTGKRQMIKKKSWLYSQLLQQLKIPFPTFLAKLWELSSCYFSPESHWI